jgi:hypothetical protein
VSVVELRPSGRDERLASEARSRGSVGVLLTWPVAISSLVLLIWLIPIKRYALPVGLPFRLELYRLFILVLVAALAIALAMGRTRLGFAGHAKPVLLLAAVALGSQVANAHVINSLGLQAQSLKSLSYFISFLIVFTLVTSTIRNVDEIHFVLVAVVLGATIVAVAAMYEGKFHHNLFDHLNRWLAFLQQTNEDKYNYRGGRLRVRASAQHPIALAGALLVTLPLAIYLSRRALTKARSWAWLGAALVVAMGALATVSRTAVLMLLAMAVVGLMFRAKPLLRRWPLLLALLVATHFSAPGAMKHLYKAFTPKEGLIQQQQARTSAKGSGRVSDVGPGVRRWSKNPIVGKGLGTNPTLAEPVALEASGGDEPTLGIIYDDQYLTTLVTLGALGLIGLVWFVWGAVVKIGRTVRRRVGDMSDLLVACTASCAAFAVSLFTYDGLSFVQVTLLFFVVAALGLKATTLSDA